MNPFSFAGYSVTCYEHIKSQPPSCQREMAFAVLDDPDSDLTACKAAGRVLYETEPINIALQKCDAIRAAKTVLAEMDKPCGEE